MILEFSEEIQLLDTVDVLVIGGGAAGFSAATMAARNGAKTILAERNGSLGGTTTYAEITPMMPNNYAADGIREHAVSLDQPLFLEWLEQMYSYLPEDLHKDCATYFSRQAKTVSKDINALAMEDLCINAGVRILYHFEMVKVLAEERKITTVIFLTPGGYVALKAKVFIDASGDGDFSVAAGCRYDMGDENGVCQPMTTCFKLSHIDPSKFTHELVQEKFLEAKTRGMISTCREDLLRFGYYDADVIHFNSTRVIGKSPLNPVERSEAEIEGRKQVREIIAWLRAYIPGFEHCRLHSLAAQIGVRESRRIKGIRTITKEDFLLRSKFPDGIARCNYPMDIHSSTGAGTQNIFMGISDFFEIPYGCLVPADIDNLLLAGRIISTSREINASIRVMPVACSIGQAAGTAAALSIETETLPFALNGCSVRNKLKEVGAFL